MNVIFVLSDDSKTAVNRNLTIAFNNQIKCMKYFKVNY